MWPRWRFVGSKGGAQLTISGLARHLLEDIEWLIIAGMV